MRVPPEPGAMSSKRPTRPLTFHERAWVAVAVVLGWAAMPIVQGLRLVRLPGPR